MNDIWIYKRVEYFDFVDLNSYGSQGWELVAIEQANRLHNAIYVFKKRV